MLKAFHIQYSFAVAAELTADERQAILDDAVAMAERIDHAENDLFVFDAQCRGKTWKVYIDLGRQRIGFLTPEQAQRAGLPGAQAGPR